MSIDRADADRAFDLLADAHRNGLLLDVFRDLHATAHAEGYEAGVQDGLTFITGDDEALP